MGEMVESNYLQSYIGKKVLITGHTGFKGSWLSYLLHMMGAKVLGFSLPEQNENSHFNLLNLKNYIQHVEGDIRNKDDFVSVMNEFKPEYVFHLAAQALVRPSYDEPVDTFETNILGSVNLLEAVKQCESVKSLVYITSDKCYENQEWVWGYRENDHLGGHDPYSASKAAAEIVFSAYQRSFYSHRPNLGAATTRAGNVIGGGDMAIDRIIPDCIRAIRSNSAIKIRSPKATRPWQHVLEPISGYLKLASVLRKEPKLYSGSWNFGPNSSEIRTVQEIVQRTIDRYGSGRIEYEKNQTQQHEAQLLHLNCDKAFQQLGWQPRWNVDKTLEVTTDWYKAVDDGIDAEVITKQQLYDYFTELE